MAQRARSEAAGPEPDVLREDTRGRRAWTRDALSPGDWLVFLPSRCVDELDAVARQVRREPLPTVLLEPARWK